MYQFGFISLFKGCISGCISPNYWVKFTVFRCNHSYKCIHVLLIVKLRSSILNNLFSEFIISSDTPCIPYRLLRGVSILQICVKLYISGSILSTWYKSLLLSISRNMSHLSWHRVLTILLIMTPFKFNDDIKINEILKVHVCNRYQISWPALSYWSGSLINLYRGRPATDCFILNLNLIRAAHRRESAEILSEL